MKSYNLLIVDDEKNILNSLSRTFEEEDCIVFTAQGGQEALQLLENEKIDIIISDQKMPGMSGIEFLEKTISAYPDIIRILLTGFADLETTMRAVNSGCVYKFLLKPWNDDDLKITVRRALEQRELILKNRNLTMDLKIKDTILEDLEKQYPGITERPKDKIYVINTELQK